MKVAFFSARSYDKDYFERSNKGGVHQITYLEASLNPDTANLTKGFDAVCAFVNDTLDKKTIELIAQNGIKVILLRCAGFNNVDVPAAFQNNLAVLRVPGYSPEAVAEHAVALILTLNRKTHKAFNRVRDGNFSPDGLAGFNLHGKTVGVIGTGLIGAAFCRIMLGFGCRVIAFDKRPSPDLKGVEYLSSTAEIFRAADIISLHCPLTPETRHLINKEALAMMKDNVMIINTSRGAVIDTLAVIGALKTGKVGYLGMDVYEQEENLFFRDLSGIVIQDDTISRLMTFPNVLITAHQGFFTREALEQIAQTTLNNLSDFENGIASKNKIAMPENQ